MNQATSPGLTSYHLKWIAILSMIWDHTFKLFYYNLYMWIDSTFHSSANATYLMSNVVWGLGRIAFPLFAFMIAQGYLHTHSIQKYVKRLALLALISEIPYQILICLLERSPITLHWGLSNVFVTLFLGAISCHLLHSLKIKRSHFSIRLIVLLLILSLGWFLQCDYGATGILLIVLFSYSKNQKQMLQYTCLGLFLIYPVHDISLMLIQGQFDFIMMYVSFISFAFSLLCLPLLKAYNHKLGRSAKFLFYSFYPLHLILLEMLYCLTL